MALDDELPPDDRAGSVRVAFAIGRSVGSAVVRNRVRRRLQAILRTLDLAAPLAPGRYLVVVSSDAASAPFDDLRHHLSRLVTDGS